jgi:hypothetical protein
VRRRDAVWHDSGAAAEARNISPCIGRQRWRRVLVEAKSGYAKNTISRVSELDNHYL